MLASMTATRAPPTHARLPACMRRLCAINVARSPPPGVLEAVRISCAGFPSKRPFPDFVDHFWPLAPELYHRQDLDDRCAFVRASACMHSCVRASACVPVRACVPMRASRVCARRLS